MFQKCNSKQEILQLSKVIIALIMTVLILQGKLSIHTVQCNVTFQIVSTGLLRFNKWYYDKIFRTIQVQ